MTPPDLPEDLSQWPTDPFKLLGVARDVDEPTLKRAYARLIRTYKPDHAPEAFRRIRDAYDAIRNRRSAGWLGDFQVSGNVRPDAEETAPLPGNTGREAGPARNLQSDVDAAWKLAERGEYVEAHQRLRQLAATAPDDEEIAVRLSWLLQLAPGLEQSWSAAEPLAPILRRVGLKGRVGDLYLRLLEGDLTEAISDRCGALLTKSRSQGRLPELARARWKAAAAENQWYLILTELKRLDDELVDDVRLWLTLHLTALELAATSRLPTAQTVLSRCQSAFSDHEDLALTEQWLFDRADELLATAADRQRFLEVETEQRIQGGTTPLSALVELISTTQGTEEGSRRTELLSCLEEWLRNPGDALAVLDAFQHYFPALALRLLRLVQAAGDAFAIREQELSGQELRSRLQLAVSDRRIKDVSNTVAYRSLRVELLQFCLEEFADVNDVAQALMELHPTDPAGQNSWAWQLQRDVAFRCIVSANLAFWLRAGS